MTDTQLKLWQLVDAPLAQLREAYEQLFGEQTRTRDRVWLLKRIGRRLLERERCERVAENAAKPRWTAQDIAEGRARPLRCDRCRKPRIVSAQYVEKLRVTRPSTFLCSDCRADDRRRSHERAALERTRKEIEKQHTRRRAAR